MTCAKSFKLKKIVLVVRPALPSFKVFSPNENRGFFLHTARILSTKSHFFEVWQKASFFIMLVVRSEEIMPHFIKGTE